MVAIASRRERVYKRAGEPSVLFCGRGAAALLDNAVVLARPYVNYACRDERLHDSGALRDEVGRAALFGRLRGVASLNILPLNALVRVM